MNNKRRSIQWILLVLIIAVYGMIFACGDNPGTEVISIANATLSYTNISVTQGATAGNTASPTTNIGTTFLSNDDALADAVAFTIEKKAGTTGNGPVPSSSGVSIASDTGIITIASAQEAFTATEYTVTMAGKGKYTDSKTTTITLTVTATYGTPAAITANTNDGNSLMLTWDEFTNDTDTEYTVYAYNLTIRTPAGSTAPNLTEFLAGKNDVTDIISVMSPITGWSGLTESITSSTGNTALNLFTNHAYVFMVTGTDNTALITDKVAAGIITIQSSEGNDAKAYIKTSNNGTDFHVVIIDSTGGASWDTAVAYAKTQGGSATLVEINSSDEQTLVEDAIALVPDSEITRLPAYGGNARYLWIGATDKTTEGTWVWDGNDDGSTTPLGMMQAGSWTGTAYQNWGTSDGTSNSTQNEPDDFRYVQDHGAIAVDAWPLPEYGLPPLGSPYQWNDISGTNQLSGYVLELHKNW